MRPDLPQHRHQDTAREQSDLNGHTEQELQCHTIHFAGKVAEHCWQSLTRQDNVHPDAQTPKLEPSSMAAGARQVDGSM